MKINYKILYHIFYWIYRAVDGMIYNHYLWDTDWYWGAFWVQFIMMPFFYIHYTIILYTINKNKIIYFSLTLIWALCFIYVYSHWTMYRNYILYNSDKISPPMYTEVFNNLIALWIISSAIFFIDYYIDTRKKNLELERLRKTFEIKKQKLSMLPDFVPSVISSIERQSIDQIPKKILLLSDLFKYILYFNEKKVSVGKELELLKIYHTLRNIENNTITITVKDIKKELNIYPTQLIYLIEKIFSSNNSRKAINALITTDNDLIYLHINKELFLRDSCDRELFQQYSIKEEGEMIIFNIESL